MAAACTPPEHAQAHSKLKEAARVLRATESTLRNAISAHKVTNPLSFSSIEAFATSVTQTSKVVRAGQLFLGSLDGQMFVSARLRSEVPAPPAGRKKRSRDDCADRAKATCTKLHKIVSVSDDPARNKEQVDLAQSTIENLLRNVKGPSGEEVFESCGVSLANVQACTASATASVVASAPARRPRMIIACRLSAGMPLPLGALREALGNCFNDGMITTNPESLGPDYQLPLTEHGKVVERNGQRSMLLFAAVPDPPPTPKAGSR